MPDLGTRLQSIDEISRKRLHRLSKEAVSQRFLNPGFDKDLDAFNLHQLDLEMRASLDRHPPHERGAARDNLRQLLRDYAAARVDFTFQGRPAFKAVDDKIEEIKAATKDRNVMSSLTQAADPLIDQIILNTAKTMQIAGKATPASHTH